jgi:uncharacterized protein YneF (UPF0154 family)
MNKTLKTIIVLLLIFICGIVIGAGGTLIAERILIKRAIENPAKVRAVLAQRIARQCDLTSEQKETIKNILTDQAREFAAIRMDVAPDIERVLQNGHDRIMGELDESQKVKFEEHYSRMIEKFRKSYYSYEQDSLDDKTKGDAGMEESDSVESQE